jgi:carbon storage regulator
MLVLARSVGQSLVLDDRITVRVLGVRGTLVRLGIEAESGIGVRRGELELLAPGHASGSNASDGVPPLTDR